MLNRMNMTFLREKNYNIWRNNLTRTITLSLSFPQQEVDTFFKRCWRYYFFKQCWRYYFFKRSCKFFLFSAIRAQSVSFSRQLMTDREEAPTEEHWSDFQTSGELEERTCLRPDRTRLTPSMKLPMKFGRRSGTHFFEGSTSSWCRP